MALSADIPELAALAQLAGVDPLKMVAAFNDPPSFFEHLSLVELNKITATCNRLAALNSVMLAALDTYAVYAKGVLEGATFAADHPHERRPAKKPKPKVN